jgi:acetate---CoA ligase (ADP-forming)
VLVELVDDRAVALPPVSPATADRALGRLKADRLLAGYRGAAALDRSAVVAAVVGLSQLAVELGDVVEAIDINPLIVGPQGPLAVDALIEPRP